MNKSVFGFILSSLLLFSGVVYSQPVKLALLKYNGGGDWYANPTSLPNLIKFCNEQLKTGINPEPNGRGWQP